MKRKLRTYHFIVQYVTKKIVYSLQKRFPSISRWYTEHFPAVRLGQDMDAWEYSINFSSELLVAVLVLIIAGLNVIVFNPLKADYTHNDKSLAAQLLHHHSGLNNELAVKQNTVSTTVANNNGFISQAFADNEPRVLGATTTIDNEATEDGIDDNGITKANPDSVQKLVSRQVQIYETKPFDTVYTVAKQFGVSTKTIRETNGLPDHALKAGWFLVIPPVDGIVVQVTNPDISVADLSEKYRANLDQIVSYNGLEGPDAEIAHNDFIVIPGGKLPEPPKPAPSANTNKVATASKPSVPKASFVGSNKFAPGHCTAYVASKVKVYWLGNANQWMRNAKAAGATVDQNPVPGAILVTNENSRYGHVMYIESVNGTKVTASEWNYAGLFKKTTRTLDMNDSRVKGVIHP